MKPQVTEPREAWLTQLALRCCGWAERLFPDAFVFAALAVAMLAATALTLGAPFPSASAAFGSDGVTIAHHLSHAFTTMASPSYFAFLMGLYSAVLELFVPSAGGKWIIEAPQGLLTL